MKKETSIIFTGDIGFDKYMDKKWTDENLISQEIFDFFHSGDHVIANVEGALCDIDPATDPGGKGMFCHMMPTVATTVFDKMHADIYNLANNHTMDAGRPGIEECFETIERKGIKTIGVGMNIEEAAKPLYLEEAGGIGLIGVGYQPTCVPATETEPGNFPWNDYDRIQKAIQEIKKDHRWAIVVVHGGDEFCSIPMPYSREKHQKYIELGADIVIGHHPHVPQNYEIFPDGRAIFYSLGNFIFDTDYQRAQINTDTGVLLKLNLTEESFTFEPCGTKLIRGEEHIVKGEVPAIFTNISAENYEKLVPLAAKTLIHTEYARRSFLTPEEYANATEEEWAVYFTGETKYKKKSKDILNFDTMKSLAAKIPETDWQSANLPQVVAYLEREFNRTIGTDKAPKSLF